MSTLEEVKEEIKQLAKDITELDGQIETLLDNPVDNTNDRFVWERRIKNLESKLKSKRDTLSVRERHEQFLTQQQKSFWSFKQLLEWIELIKYNCTSACSSSVTQPKIKPTETLDDDYHFEPMFKFREAFDSFKSRIERKFSDQQLVPISDYELRYHRYPNVSSHDELNTKLMAFLKECKKTLFPEISIEFIPRPNQQPEFSDLYCRITDTLTQETFTRYLAEVKTTKQVDFKSDDILKQLLNKKDHLSMAIYKTAGQFLEASQTPKAPTFPPVGLLTCHDYTYLLYLNEATKTVEISSIIERQEFLQAVLLVLSISFQQFSDELGLNFDGFKEGFINNTPLNTPRNSLGSSENQSSSAAQNGNHGYNLRSSNSNTQPSDATNLDESDDITFAELMKSRKCMTFIGYGGCGFVYQIQINGNSYADKLCSIYKSQQSVLDELDNEYKILTKLNTTLSDKFFPRVYFYGPTYVTMHLVMDFIDGRIYNNFKEVSVEERKQCLQRVEQLHAIGLLHGDLRAPNFIMTPSGVFIIDFGRSKFVEPGEEQLEEEMSDFQQLIKIS